MTDNHIMPDSPAIQGILSAVLAGRMEAVVDTPSWNVVVDVAERLGLAGLVLEALHDAGVGPPESAKRGLRAAATAVASANLHRARCFQPVVKAFAEADVPLMLLKGAALSLSIYPRPNLRPMSDVDCMVRPQDVERAVAVLESLGCRRGAALVRDDFFPTYFNEVEYFTPDEPAVRIDLHVRPFRPLRYAQSIPPEAFWTDARAIGLDGVRVCVPGPNAMMIHLAAHAAIHGAGRLLWLYDIRRFALNQSAELDWAVVAGCAESWGLTLPVRVALERAEAAFGPFVPAGVMARLRRARVGIRDRLTLWHAPRDEAHPLGHLLVDLLGTRGLRFRAGYLAAVLWPQAQHLGSIYPYRHAGWTLCAHAYRLVRAVRRVLPVSVVGDKCRSMIWGAGVPPALHRRDAGATP
jgi:hypothetical protein